MTPRRARWDALWQRLGAVPSEEAFAELERQYSAPGRHYHTLAHLDAVLVTFDELRHLAPNPDIAELALWLHDVIWEPMRDDCEQRSVEWAMNHLPALPALPALNTALAMTSPASVPSVSRTGAVSCCRAIAAGRVPGSRSSASVPASARRSGGDRLSRASRHSSASIRRRCARSGSGGSSP